MVAWTTLDTIKGCQKKNIEGVFENKWGEKNRGEEWENGKMERKEECY